MASIIPPSGSKPPWTASAPIHSEKPVMSPEASLFRTELQQGEHLRWTGRPLPCAWAKTWRTCLFGVPFGGFAVFWTVQSAAMAKGSSAWPWFPLFGIPFLLIGAGMLLSPIWQFWKEKSTAYAISDRRIMIVCAFPRRTVQSFFARDIEPLEKTTQGNGTETLIFRREVRDYGGTDGSGWHTIRHGFYCTPDVSTAEQQIERLVGNAR